MKIHSLPDAGTPLPSKCEVGLIGDPHRGIVFSHTAGWKAALHWVKGGKNRRAFLMGDTLDGIPANDKRYDPTLVDPDMTTVMEQSEVVSDELAPYADRILGLVNSNHSLASGVRAVGDLDKDLVARVRAKSGVEIPRLTYEAIIVLDEAAEHKWFLSHGFGSINSGEPDEAFRRAQMERQLRKALIRKPAGGRIVRYDLKAMGHTHKLLVRRPQMIQGPEIDVERGANGEYRLQAKYAHDDPTWYVNTGSFLRLWLDGVSGYANIAGYDPVDLGHVVVTVVDNEVRDVQPRMVA